MDEDDFPDLQSCPPFDQEKAVNRTDERRISLPQDGG
jgi:hypothetical protein